MIGAVAASLPVVVAVGEATIGRRVRPRLHAARDLAPGPDEIVWRQCRQRDALLLLRRRGFRRGRWVCVGESGSRRIR